MTRWRRVSGVARCTAMIGGSVVVLVVIATIGVGVVIRRRWVGTAASRCVVGIALRIGSVTGRHDA
jgi:hypothetical protein